MSACTLAPFLEWGWGGTWFSGPQILVAPGDGHLGEVQPRAERRWEGSGAESSRSLFPSEHLHRESIPGEPTHPIPRSWHRQPESSSHRSRWVRPAVTQALGAVAFVAVGSALAVAGGTRALGAAGSGASFGVSPPCCPCSALRRAPAGERGGAGALPPPRGLRGDDAVFWSPLLLFRGRSLGVTGRAKGALVFGQALHASGHVCGWRGRRGAVAPNTFAVLGPVSQPPSGLHRPDTGCLMLLEGFGKGWPRVP